MTAWCAGALVAALLAASPALAAADAAGAQAALVRAEAAATVAAGLHDQWTPTVAALAAARAAAAKGDDAAAIRLADDAHRLATLSIQQAGAQQKLWPAAVVR